MMQQVLSNFHLPILPCVGLLLFMAVFLGNLFWVLRKGSRSYYESIGEMPLTDEKTWIEERSV